MTETVRARIATRYAEAVRAGFSTVAERSIVAIIVIPALHARLVAAIAIQRAARVAAVDAGVAIARLSAIAEHAIVTIFVLEAVNGLARVAIFIT